MNEKDFTDTYGRLIWDSLNEKIKFMNALRLGCPVCHKETDGWGAACCDEHAVEAALRGL